MSSISMYIHVPFCMHRCGYCDFNTYAGLDALIPAYTQAVCREIELLSSGVNGRLPIGTIYLGGGTPSLLPITDLEKILLTVSKYFQLDKSPEISIEANPGTLTETFLVILRSLGVNRLSLGMQSANQFELKLLDRQHSFEDVVNAVAWARAAGFNNLNLDLIFGLPFQRLSTWMANLETALSLQPEHLSLYALSIEMGTPLYNKVKAGILHETDQDHVADMYETATERLADAGYFQYEISNWTRVDQNGEQYSCKHNLQYWRNLPYLGVGAGAHGFINHQRTVNVSTPGEYIKRLDFGSMGSGGINGFPCTPATLQITPIDVDTEISETMMMGLRLVSEGVSHFEFERRFGMSLRERFTTQIERLIRYSLLEWAGEEMEFLRLTQKGRLLGNQVFKEFI
ncbi:MAG: hypothetical protein A2Y53_01780 [Chloroflexi bacterium RBG_16_47_49]|nr:MAG: hypothetical protein A2Y53_01780 [Chloroflexi bacterium RBG_16_47_49]